MNYSKELPSEDEHIEYKKNKQKLTKDLWETVCAFENTDGGTIILGITEVKQEKKRFKITGVQDPQMVLEDFWSTIKNVISFNMIKNEDIKVNDIKGKKIIEIKVKEAPDNKKPIFSHGQIYIRQGSLDIRADNEEKKVLIRQSHDDLDTKVLKNYDNNDLNIEDIRKYKEILEKRPQYSYYKNMCIKDFLIRIGVKTKDYEGNGEYGITAGGLLFFGKNNAILHTFPNFQLDYFDKTDPSERWSTRISSVEDDLNVFSFFEKISSAIEHTIPDKFELDSNLRRIDTGGSIRIALREAIINMLMHADYFGDEPIKAIANINFYEFTNPGKMKIPSSDFFTSNNSKTRNPVISKLFVQIGNGERAGQGGEKIYQAAVENNFRVPKISTDVRKTNLKIWKVAYLKSFSGKDITDREKAILESIFVGGSRPLSHKEIERKTGLTRAVTTNAINSLLSKKIIIKYGNARSTRYGVPSTNEQMMAQLQIMPSIMRNIIATENRK